MFCELAEAGPQTDSGKGKQECPAGEISQGGQLGLGEEADGGQQRDQKKAQDELRELLPQKCAFVFNFSRLSFGGPIYCIAEDDEADQCVAAGLGQHGKFSGGVRVDGPGSGGLGGVVNREPGPEAIRVLAEMECVPNEREKEERHGAQSQDGGDGVGGVLLFGVNGSLGGDDGGDSADRRADGEQRGELGREAEPAAQIRHKGKRKGQFDGDKYEAGSSKAENVAENEARTEKHDSGLEPELISGDTGLKYLRQPDGVGDCETNQDGPENVFDIGQDQMVRLAVMCDELLDKLACITSKRTLSPS